MPSILPSMAFSWSHFTFRSGTSQVQRTYLRTTVLEIYHMSTPFSNMSTLISESPGSHPMIQEESAISDGDILKYPVLKTFDSRKKLSQQSRTGYYTRTLKTFMSLYSSTTLSQPGLNLMGSTEDLVEISNLPKVLFQNSSYWCSGQKNSWFIMTWKSESSHVSALRSQSLTTSIFIMLNHSLGMASHP